MPTLADRPQTALLVVDVQNAVVGNAHQRDAVVGRIAGLVERARAEEAAVVWVQHSDDHIEEGSDGWRIVAELEPGDEPIVHKNYGDAFEATPLESLLAEREVGRLVVVGAETDACIRSTLHGAITAATTRRWSATRTRPTTTPSGARRRPTWSSRTPTSTGITTPPRVERPGR